MCVTDGDVCEVLEGCWVNVGAFVSRLGVTESLCVWYCIVILWKSFPHFVLLLKSYVFLQDLKGSKYLFWLIKVFIMLKYKY